MMNYLKYFFFIVGIVMSFLVLSSSASAGGSCFATSPTTASFQLTGCPNPGHGALYFIDSPFWWSYTIKSSYAFCNSSGSASGLSPGTWYNFSGFDSNNLPRGSCSLTTPALVPPPPTTGTVRITPNIASAPWTLTGPLTNQSGTGSVNLTNKNTGTYNITWNPVAGYTATGLNPQSLLLTAGGTITFSRTYTPIGSSVLTISKIGTGSGTVTSSPAGINCGPSCMAPFTDGSFVTFTATPAPGSVFDGWYRDNTMTWFVGYYDRNGVLLPDTNCNTGTSCTWGGVGAPVTFYPKFTSSFSVPTLITLIPSSITSSSALLGFSFSNTGGAPITAKGLCWGTTPNPTTNCNDYGPGSGAPGEWGGVITGMPSGTLIYFRAYGINSAGTGWSVPSMSFTTLSAPTIDLTASAVTPTTAVALAPTSFSSTISNTGTSGTGVSFTSLFQFDDADHSVVFASQNSPTPAISAGGTTNISTSYTFPSTGTWYVRACADNNTAFVGTIAETNEGNNCGAVWTPVTVGATAGTLTTPNCTISTGLSSCNSTVSWSITNPVAPNSVRQNGISFSPASSGSMSRTLAYGGPNDFTLYSNATTLITNTATASCTLGTSWNGSACVAPVFSCTGVTPPSATIYAGDTTGLVANTPKTYNITNTATKCEFSCNAGFSWNGTSCVASACGDGVCNGVETLLTCPRDCKTKVIQF